MKGQIFSVDFIIASAIVVLCIGMALNYYDLASSQANEAQIVYENGVVAATASNILLEKHPCALDSSSGEAGFRFAQEGYALMNCSSLTILAPNANSKNEIMVPSGFNCHAELDGVPIVIAECAVLKPPSSAANVSVVDRNFVDKITTLSKSSYDKCVNSSSACAGVYTVNKLEVYVWR